MKNIILITILIFSYSFANCQWYKLDSLSKGVYCFASNNSYLLAGTSYGGIFKSTDDGITWLNINVGLTNTNVRSIVINDTNIFAGTEGGVFLSSNNGTSWISVNNGLTSLDVFSLIVKDKKIYAATFGGGVFMSNNNGANWTAINNGLLELNVRSLFLSDTTIFAGTFKGVYITYDNGSNWIEKNIGVPISLINGEFCTIMAFSENNYTGILASAWSGGIINTNNNGDNWNILNYYNSCIHTLVSADSTIIAGHDGVGISYSNNNGSNWQTINSGLIDLDIYSLYIKGIYIFAGSFQGFVFRRLLTDITNIEANNIIISSKLFPNPNNGKFVINSESKISSIEIYNVLGKNVNTINENNMPCSREIDISFMPKGIYFVKIDNGVQIHTEKIIIN